ncbi:MAG: flagellar basal-body MS-ring/collar protein FliF, partial [bacterium]
MATGIKSTINTGSGTLQTPPGRSHGAAQAHGGSYFGKIIESWSKLDTRKKLIITMTGIALVLVFTVFNFYSRATGYIELYPQQELTVQDTRDITLRLAQMKIPYKEEEHGTSILVPPSIRSRAQINLAGYGLPHRPVYTMENEGTGLKLVNQTERNYMLNLQKQADIILALRSIEGIADANVQLVPAEDNDFANDSTPAKAAAMLEILPGARLSSDQINGIVHFVSYSIKGLTPTNVTVVDQNGRILNDENMMAEENHKMSNNAVQKQAEEETRREQKAQSLLDRCLGPNKAWVRVSVILDLDDSETVSERYGPPGHPGGSLAERELKEKETFFQNPRDFANVHQLAIQGEDMLKNTNYSKEKTAIQRYIDKVKVIRVKRAPSIQKITASVTVDNLSSKKIEDVRQVVAGAIGLDESRGDKIYVASFPFHVNLYQKLRE